MKFSESLKTSVPKKEEFAGSIANWPACYYEEKDPAKRRAMLDKAIESELSPEEDEYRKMLFDRRYSPSQYGESGYADNFMRCFMDFNLLTKNPPTRFGASKAKKSVLKDLADLGIGAEVDNEELYNSILVSLPPATSLPAPPLWELSQGGSSRGGRVLSNGGRRDNTWQQPGI